MKVLFVIGEDFPYNGACTNLLNNILFVGGFCQKDVSVDVLALKDKFSGMGVKTFNDVDVHSVTLPIRVSKNEYVLMMRKHPVKALGGLIKKSFAGFEKSNMKRMNISAIQNKIEQLLVNGYDAIVIILGDFEAAKAVTVTKAGHPEVKTVLYQVDPCSTNDVLIKKGCIDEYIELEKEFYKSFDRIVTTPIIKEEAKEKYSEEILDKIIPMEFPDVVPCVNQSLNDGGKIRCVFTGSIYADFRDPTYTLRLFSELKSNISFEIIGKVKADYQRCFDKYNVVYHGRKSLEETKKEILCSDILVNIGNEMTNQVPSKIFEYISYGKPIINICKNRNCPTLKYLERYPLALNLYEEDDIFDEQVSRLNDFILNNHKKNVSESEILSVFKECTPEYCAKLLYETINCI